MSYCGYVVKVKDLRKHSNADRLQVATFFGNDTIVDLNVHEGDIGIYFPTDGQLSERFCAVNDLVRRKDENGNQCGGYMDPVKRNIKAIKLRGEKSDGLYLPITCLSDFCTISELKPGDKIDTVNGETICQKYIPHKTRTPGAPGSRHYKAKVNIAPTFYEHVETEQLAYNLAAFHNGDLVQLTLKMHGTSGRTGYLPLVVPDKQNWLQKLFHRPPRQHLEYGYVTGTRRVVLTPKNLHHGYYESDDFRVEMANKFEGKLHRGEVVYYEIVGFQGPDGAPIMAQVANSKIKDKEFSKKYGDTTTFSYFCEQDGGYEGFIDDNGVVHNPCCEVYVYRMTMVNEDGDVVEYSPDQIRERCEQMGVNYVMEFERFIIPPDVDPGEYVVRKVEQYFDGPDPIGKTHIREGVVARICNRTKFAVYKHKNFSFKVLEGIAKDEATAPDIEEAQEELVEEEVNE